MNDVSSRSRIDLIGIGVQKAGTDWLFRSLTAHPQINTGIDTPNKELNFFTVNYPKGYHWYHDKFSFKDPVCAEYSVGYFPEASVPPRIHQYHPEIKMLLSLRDPVERAISQHKHELRRGRLPDSLRSFSRALESNPSYVEQGHYASHLQTYLSFFDRSQIHVVFLQDIAESPKRVTRDLYDFLGVNPDFTPSHLHEKVNRARRYRSRSVARLIRETSDGLRKLIGARGIEWIKKTKIPALLRSWNEPEMNQTVMPRVKRQTRQRLRKTFKEEVSNLERILDRDLSAWK